MSVEVKVPALPESVSDATVVTWHKQPGDVVSRDENLVDLETDKVVLEVPAPEDGILSEIKAADGSTVTADQVLAVIEAGAVAKKADKPATSKAEAKKEIKTETKHATISAGELSPSARRAASEHGVDATQISGSGKGGRVVKDDILKVATQPQAVAGAREEKRVPMSRMRARIAERLVEAQQTAAMLTTFNEVDLQAVMELRKQYKDTFEKKHGVRLGFMSFFTKAAIEALKRFPSVNASIDGSDVVYHGYYDIGIAVSTDRGLVVPVLRDADQMSMANIEKQIRDFGEKARDNKITMEDMTGGTFTITNGGVFGSLVSTPILNPPQSAILGMHKIQERPVVVDGQVVVRPMMYLALTYDHRIIDGKESVQFLVTIKEMLEDPARLLLEV